MKNRLIAKGGIEFRTIINLVAIFLLTITLLKLFEFFLYM